MDIFTNTTSTSRTGDRVSFSNNTVCWIRTATSTETLRDPIETVFGHADIMNMTMVPHTFVARIKPMLIKQEIL